MINKSQYLNAMGITQWQLRHRMPMPVDEENVAPIITKAFIEEDRFNLYHWPHDIYLALEKPLSGPLFGTKLIADLLKALDHVLQQKNRPIPIDEIESRDITATDILFFFTDKNDKKLERSPFGSIVKKAKHIPLPSIQTLLTNPLQKRDVWRTIQNTLSEQLTR